MGNSLNEVLPFLLGDGNISGFPNFNKSEMMASLENSKRSENWRRRKIGDAQFWDAQFRDA